MVAWRATSRAWLSNTSPTQETQCWDVSPATSPRLYSKGASYFDIGSEWDRLIAEGKDPWELNQHFLDTRIAAGDRMLLSVPKNRGSGGNLLRILDGRLPGAAHGHSLIHGSELDQPQLAPAPGGVVGSWQALAPLVGPVGFIMPLFHSVSLPWDAGPVSQTQQTLPVAGDLHHVRLRFPVRVLGVRSCQPHPSRRTRNERDDNSRVRRADRPPGGGPGRVRAADRVADGVRQLWSQPAAAEREPRGRARDVGQRRWRVHHLHEQR